MIKIKKIAIKKGGTGGGAHFLRQKKKVKKGKEGNEKWKKEEKREKIGILIWEAYPFPFFTQINNSNVA